MAVIVHRFDRPGRYAMALSPDGEQVVETRTIFVGEQPDEPTAAKDAPRARRLEPPRPDRGGAPLPLALAVNLIPSPDPANAAAPSEMADVAALSEGGYAT